MRAALDDREALIERRADAILEVALTESAPWTTALGTPPTDRRRAATWRKAARVVAAYRDRYRITDDAPIGAPPESAAQKIDAARARAALDLAKAADVTWVTAQKWVKGETFPTTEHLGRIVPWLRKKGITATLDDFVEVAA